ncbi:hypothetical protein [Vibrio vulnificus]|uniref:hypothetical protein n=1 Tax=Vibrio vulnificus TaxID=672 RepID=UPI0002F0F09B|nr:hypothetical protein [Vibrio vulnificus]ASM99108.1 hypothetical protein AOT11_06560 [Vibrio vulnificus NBRC 15645 = ATCC 27562]EGQ7998855.1 hypothetical protein [Vibrio vulnificus]ELF6471095.1 hypothetical protein [Vibrio vulnificus]MCA3896278.1 hypothetical protein [Vibrio vulnificus]MCL7017717.1 hypothetical protein [Vibrio vulnificus]
MNNFAIETMLIILLVLFVLLVAMQAWLWLRPFAYDLRLPIALKQSVRSLMTSLDQVKPQGVIEMRYADLFEQISLRKTPMQKKIELVKSLFDEVKTQPVPKGRDQHEQEIITASVHQFDALLSQASLSSRSLCYSNTGYFISACGVWLCQILLAKEEGAAASVDEKNR